MASWGNLSPIPHPWTNLEVFTTFLSHQFDASSPIYILSNIKIFIESKNTGGNWRQNIHLSIQSALKWDIAYKIASIDLRLDRPQLQHWLLF